MEIVDVLRELGGIARRHQLLDAVDRAALEAAIGAGAVLRDSRGLYHLPGTDSTDVLLRRFDGVLCLTSAALAHGWAVKTVPDRPHIMISRGRRVPADIAAHVHYAELEPAQVDGHRLSQSETLRQCLRQLPFDEGLSIADSALREGFDPRRLRAIAADAKGPGSPQMVAIAAYASPRAANPFESALRAIARDVPGLDVQPQQTIAEGNFSVRPDLVDRRLHIALEADSFTWHGQRDALASDTRRYNHLVIRGWLVLRFCYEDVMFHPDEVRAVLVALVRLAELLGEVLGGFRYAA